MATKKARSGNHFDHISVPSVCYNLSLERDVLEKDIQLKRLEEQAVLLIQQLDLFKVSVLHFVFTHFLSRNLLNKKKHVTKKLN